MSNEPARRAPIRPKKILLIGWDGADWDLIDPLLDAGELPHLEGLVNRGVVGNLATLTPPISPMLWTSIATGKRPYKHGVLGFVEPDDHLGGVRPITNLSRKTKAIWNILSQEGRRVVVVGWWPSHPAEPIRGVMVSNRYQQAVAPLGRPWPLVAGTVHPPRLCANLEALRLHPQQIDPGLVQLFIPRLAEVDQEKDPRVARLVHTIAECANVSRAATAVLHNEPWEFAAIYLDGIDHFCHGFMPYHPPKLSTASQADFEMYQEVVNSGYRYHDLLLGGLLQAAGEDTLVMLISDHGFKSRDNRLSHVPAEPAGPTFQHRHHGILVMAGPGIKGDERIYGANLLDVCPTLLTALGLPVGRDMDGVPLVNAFIKPPKLLAIDSWDAVDGRDGCHPPDVRIDPVEAREAIRQLVDLGYIDPPDEDREKAAEESVRELDYNLACAYMDAGRHAEGAVFLKALAEKWPTEHRFGLQLIGCYQVLGRTAAARAALEGLKQRKADDAARARTELEAFAHSHEGVPLTDWQDEERHRWSQLTARAAVNPFALPYLDGCLALAEGNPEAALAALKQAHAIDPRHPGLHLKLGEAYLELKRWTDALTSFDHVLGLDPDSAPAYLGRCRSLLPRGRNRDAAEAALDAVSLVYHNPMGHFLLGTALQRLGQPAAAIEALLVAVAQNPSFARAHHRLSGLYANHLTDPEKADHHRRRAREAAESLRRLQQTGVIDTPAALRFPMASDQTPARPLGSIEAPVASAAPDLARTVVVVTGLPRAGTSMLMQMLRAGGIPLLADDHRPADEDNPRGYFEYALVKGMRQDGSWLAQAVGRAVKVVAPLLDGLGPGPDYCIVLVERDLDEVLRSQQRMLARRELGGGRLSDERLKAVYARQLQQVRQHLCEKAVPTLIVEHRGCVTDPQATADRINAFFGGCLDAPAMARAVDPGLYRQRMAPGGS